MDLDSTSSTVSQLQELRQYTEDYLSNTTDWQVHQLRTRALSTNTVEGSFAEISKP